MRFDTYIPSDILKPFIRSFAVQEVVAEKTYKVLPDTGVVIGFQFKGRLARVENGIESALSISGVSGLADHSRTFKNSPGIGAILVFFREAGAVPFFRSPCTNFSGKVFRWIISCFGLNCCAWKSNWQRPLTTCNALLQLKNSS